MKNTLKVGIGIAKLIKARAEAQKRKGEEGRKC